jgi:hypothetical protein
VRGLAISGSVQSAVSALLQATSPACPRTRSPRFHTPPMSGPVRHERAQSRNSSLVGVHRDRVDGRRAVAAVPPGGPRRLDAHSARAFAGVVALVQLDEALRPGRVAANRGGAVDAVVTPDFSAARIFQVLPGEAPFGFLTSFDSHPRYQNRYHESSAGRRDLTASSSSPKASAESSWRVTKRVTVKAQGDPCRLSAQPEPPIRGSVKVRYALQSAAKPIGARRSADCDFFERSASSVPRLLRLQRGQ